MPTCFRLVSLLIISWESELSVRIFSHVRIWKSVTMIKCVCVQLTRNKATFKESVTVCILRFRPKVPNQTKLVVGEILWRGSLSLSWLGPLLECPLWCPLWWIPVCSHRLCHLCKIHVNSVRRVTSLRRPYIWDPLNDLCSWGGLHSSLLVQLCF